MKCLKTYKADGTLYEAGKEYDISTEKAEQHEQKMGSGLWLKKKSEDNQQEPQDDNKEEEPKE